MTDNPKHLSESNEQYTPVHVIEMAREVLGDIDLDPASSELANYKRVGAKKIFTRHDGERTFTDPWWGNVFLNPPGGAKMAVEGTIFQSNPVLFWAKLLYEWKDAERTKAAIFIGFNMDVMQTTQALEEWSVLRFPFCIPSKRLRFDIPRVERIAQLNKRLAKGVADSTRKTLERQIAELEAATESLVTGDSPPHGNVIVCVPPLDECLFSWDGPVTQKFARVFKALGQIKI